jgi:hypothetical protein
MSYCRIKRNLDISNPRARLGVFITDLATDRMPPGTSVLFTFYWPEANRWEGADFKVIVE